MNVICGHFSSALQIVIRLQFLMRLMIDGTWRPTKVLWSTCFLKHLWHVRLISEVICDSKDIQSWKMMKPFESMRSWPPPLTGPYSLWLTAWDLGVGTHQGRYLRAFAEGKWICWGSCEAYSTVLSIARWSTREVWCSTTSMTAALPSQLVDWSRRFWQKQPTLLIDLQQPFQLPQALKFWSILTDCHESEPLWCYWGDRGGDSASTAEQPSAEGVGSALCRAQPREGSRGGSAHHIGWKGIAS